MIELPEKKEIRFKSEILFPAEIGKIQSIIESLNKSSEGARRGFEIQKKNDCEFFVQSVYFSRSFFWVNKRVDPFESAAVKLETVENKTKVSLEFDGTKNSYSREYNMSLAKNIFRNVTDAIYSRI